MTSTPRLYTVLPGTGYRRMLPGWALVLLFFALGIFVLLLRGRRVKLWQGPDHLLEVESDGYRERYARFYYTDIEAVVVRKTRSGLWTNMIAALLAVPFVALALLVADPAWRVTWAVVAALLALLLLVNGLRGPTCECHLQTAVQTRDLPSLNRLAAAGKLIDRLRPLIEAAQRNRGEAPAVPPAPATDSPAPASLS